MEYQYFLCLEYKNPTTKNYRKIYFSFGPNGLIYDYIYQYNLEQIDYFLSTKNKSQILKQMQQDNILYFVNNSIEEQYFELSIRHYEKEKERISVPLLKDGCYEFNILEYFQNNLTKETRKKLYNKLGGYIVNNHTKNETKQWIKNIITIETESLIQSFFQLPYEEQRKLKAIIYDYETKELQLESNQILKKTQDKAA